MEISDRDTIVYSALRVLRNAVLSYVRPRLNEEFGAEASNEIRNLFQKEWAEIERSAITAQQTGAVNRVPIDALDHLSVNHLATLFEKWWKVLIPNPSIESQLAGKQRANVIQWLRELTGVRNPVSHSPEEAVALPDAVRPVDSALRVAALLGLDEATERLRTIYSALVDTSGVDEIVPLVVDELPSRELITTEFVGREDHLADLFRWLSDEDRSIWLLAGDGGKGKTTVAYEFATRSRPVLSEFGLCGTLWMSAKRRKFAEGEPVPTTSDFFDLQTGLEHILNRLGVGADPTLDARDNRRICRDFLDEFPVLIVADDIDSLEGTEEEAITFLVHDVARTKSKVLLTSRRQHFGLGGCTTQIEGLDEEEVGDLVRRRAAALGIDKSGIGAKVIREIRSITDGSPLYIEDMLRFACFYGLKRAISEWSGRGGDAAREYSMRRELEKLSDDATLCLGVLAFADQPISLEECAVIADLANADAMRALEELTRWNLATKPGLIKDLPRFACSRNLAKLMTRTLEGSDQELRIRNGIKGVQGGTVAGSRVRAWNQQAVALKQRGQLDAAEETLVAGLEEVPNSGEIYSQLGWLYSKWEPTPRTTDAREAFRKARTLGAMSRHLYAHWASMELKNEEYRQAADLCEEAVQAVCRSDNYLWRLGGRVYTQLGTLYQRSLSPDNANKSFVRGNEMLKAAQELSRTDGDRSRALKNRYNLARVQHDQDEMRRVLEEWERILPDDPYRESVTS